MDNNYKIENIILIDDDEVSNFIAGSVLNDLDIAENVTIFESAAPALDYVTRQKSQSEKLIFLDINMPEMNGFEFLDAYYEYLKGKEGAVIAMFVTSSLNEAEKITAQRYRNVVAQFIEKPLTANTVINLIEAYFAKK
jgi:CheY-like chemotaxis protein